MKKGGLNPKDPLLSQKWSDLRQFFVGQGKKKYHNLKIFKSQYLSDYLRYGQYGVSRHSFIDFRKMHSPASNNERDPCKVKCHIRAQCWCPTFF